MIDAGEQVREEARAWFRAHWDPSLPLREWRSLLADSGWGCPTWPVGLYGRGLPPVLGDVVLDEMRAVSAVGPAVGVGIGLVAPTLLDHGSFELNRRLLRPILTGEETWCQLFSEPGAGSDLAAVATSAARDGDEWVVNGQKLWTTGAANATFGLLLARTDAAAPKHRGMTAFAFPMRRAGVDVRPLRQMNGYASFNEVFITDGRVGHANVVGAVNAGWEVARTTLAHERHLAANLLALIPQVTDGRAAQEALAEAAAYFKTYEWYPQRQGRADLAPALAREAGRATHPVVRQHLARLHSLDRIMRWTALRAAAARARDGRPGPEGSVGKLAASRLARMAALTHGLIAGPEAVLTGDDARHGGVVAEIISSVPAQSIAGGTDEIQKNILGEKVLGLPRETAPE